MTAVASLTAWEGVGAGVWTAEGMALEADRDGEGLDTCFFWNLPPRLLQFREDSTYCHTELLSWPIYNPPHVGFSRTKTDGVKKEMVFWGYDRTIYGLPSCNFSSMGQAARSLQDDVLFCARYVSVACHGR